MFSKISISVSEFQKNICQDFLNIFTVSIKRVVVSGTGLVLAIVKNIVKLHSGEIQIKSENGCEFIITFPA